MISAGSALNRVMEHDQVSASAERSNDEANYMQSSEGANGAQGGNDTRDTAIFRPRLSHLSYLGTATAPRDLPCRRRVLNPTPALDQAASGDGGGSSSNSAGGPGTR